MSRRHPKSTGTRPGVAAVDAREEEGPDAELASWLGERLRRLALGLTTALIVSRAFWPSEPDFRFEAGKGLAWVLALLAVAGAAVAAPLVGGRFRYRFSVADLGLVATVALVAMSAGYAIDRRPAINLAWGWGAVGIAYVLLRNLPRTRDESSAVAGALAATAVAVAVYGLYHVTVELPGVRAAYLANRGAVLQLMEIAPGSPAQARYEDRLLGSNDATSTFGLANSLAGFLVGPLVVMLGLAWDALARRGDKGSRWGDLALAVPPIGAVMYCLVLTKSRSAWLGLACGLLILACREWSRVRLRTLALAAVGGGVVVGGLVAAGVATGGLDRQVLTEWDKSLRFRAEYWEGAWEVINETPQTFWRGHGPGNFSDPYVLHKLPESSEEIKDPHNFALEVWAAGGLRAVIALGVALLAGLWALLGPSRPNDVKEASPDLPASKGKKAPRVPDAPPPSAGWVMGAAAFGWLLALPPVGGMVLFEGDFDRWLILGAAWLVAFGCGNLLWRRGALDASLLGAGVAAVLVNFVAAGGISVAAVALGLWTLMAIGLNLREDRPCGRLREGGGRLAAFGTACVWVALLGTFSGAVLPYWKAVAAMADADEAMAVRDREPDFDRAEALLQKAAEADPLSARPWSKMAGVAYQSWLARGGKPDDLRWRKVPVNMLKAVSPPRSPKSWGRHRDRAVMTGLLLKQLGGNLPPREATRLRADAVEASRRATLLYPTNASLRARLAEASAEIGMVPDAVKEGREALRLDELTPHADKKLDPEVRVWLKGKLPEWEEAADQAQDVLSPG